ncbi:MAG: DnaJ domain-containing protein, partial [bacterium]
MDNAPSNSTETQPSSVVAVETPVVMLDFSTLAAMGFYERLGVGHNATKIEIQDAFIKLGEFYSKDPVRDGQISLLKEAYNALTDPEKRARYDGVTERVQELRAEVSNILDKEVSFIQASIL